MSSRLEESKQIKVSKWFTALENLNDSENINRVWENIK